VKNPYTLDREIEAPDKKTALKLAQNSLIENPGTSPGDTVWLADERGTMIQVIRGQIRALR
jgi:hypothetical protein